MASVASGGCADAAACGREDSPRGVKYASVVISALAVHPLFIPAGLSIAVSFLRFFFYFGVKL